MGKHVWKFLVFLGVLVFVVLFLLPFAVEFSVFVRLHCRE